MSVSIPAPSASFFVSFFFLFCLVCAPPSLSLSLWPADAQSKIRGSENIKIGKWNTGTLRAAGKLQKLIHDVDRYRWSSLGLCEMRWKNFGETTTKEGQKVFFSRKEDKHEHCVGFLVHKDIVNIVMGYPVSSRLIIIRLRAVPFNITVLQVYAPTSDYDDKETGMQKRAKMLMKTGKAFVDPSATTTQMREDSDFWSLPLLTNLCWRTHLVITRQPENGHGIAQVDNTTTRLIIFLWGSASDQQWTLPAHEVFRTPGQRCQVCYSYIIEDSSKRQHHHSH